MPQRLNDIRPLGHLLFGKVELFENRRLLTGFSVARYDILKYSIICSYGETSRDTVNITCFRQGAERSRKCLTLTQTNVALNRW